VPTVWLVIGVKS